MAIRYAEPMKWQKKWFRKLKPNDKLLFLYLIDNCNWAGFLEIDEETISHFTGLSQKQIKEGLKNIQKDLILRDNWVWITDFVIHQKNYPLNYGQLGERGNNAHIHIANLLKLKLDIFPEVKFVLNNEIEKIKILEGSNEGLNGVSKTPSKVRSCNGNGNGNSNGKVIVKEIKKEKMQKKKFLEFVYLSEDEYFKLVGKFGELETESMIEKLNNYIGSKGKKYKSHYFTILNWERREGDNENKNLSQKDKNFLALKEAYEDAELDEREKL